MDFYVNTKVKFSDVGDVVFIRNSGEIITKCPYADTTCNEKCALLVDVVDNNGNSYLQFCNGEVLELSIDSRHQMY